MKSKVTGSNFPKLAFIRASPGDCKGRRTRVFKGLHAHNQLLRLFFGEEGGPDSATPSLKILLFTLRLRCGWWKCPEQIGARGPVK